MLHHTAMNTIKETTCQVPQQAIFYMESRKFLIDSGTSVHMWNIKWDFIYYQELDKEEHEHEQVLGVNGATSKPKGIDTVKIKIKDDLNNVHALELNEVRHLPDAPLNIFVPQAFFHQ